MEIGQTLFPFEIKYQSQPVQARDVPGLVDFCRQKHPKHAYILTKMPQDIGPFTGKETSSLCFRIPAPLFCYWLGASNAKQLNLF